jgi:uncharacterized iron-regulated protein
MRARLSCFAIVASIAALGTACGGSYGGRPPEHPKAKRGIEDAALPYQVLDGRTGRQVDQSAFWDKLGTQRAVCVGEEHKNPHHHWVELEVVRHLVKKWPHAALGMEMFQRPFQGVLDDYAAHRIDDAALRSRSGWEDRWGYDFGYYGPTIAAAVAAHAALIALNAPKELTKKVVHHGLESLSPDEKAQVPQLDLEDAAHRAWFDALMEDMGGGEAHSNPHGNPHGKQTESSEEPAGEAPAMPSADRIYTVQVIWDETMADTAAKWLEANKDGRMIILAGTGHCHDSAIVNRMKRRGIADVVSLRSVIDDGQGEVAEALVKPMNDYLIVLEMPAGVKAQTPAD